MAEEVHVCVSLVNCCSHDDQVTRKFEKAEIAKKKRCDYAWKERRSKDGRGQQI